MAHRRNYQWNSFTRWSWLLTSWLWRSRGISCRGLNNRQLFTDGAVEDDFGAVANGALLVDQCICRRFYFGGHIPQPLVDEWRAKRKWQLISQAEMFPILVSKETLAGVMHQRSVLWSYQKLLPDHP